MKTARIVSLAAIAVLAVGAAAVAQDQTPLASNFLYNYYTPPGASLVTAGHVSGALPRSARSGRGAIYLSAADAP